MAIVPYRLRSAEKHQNRINQCLAGEFKKAGVKAGIGLWEFRIDGDEGSELEVGAEIGVDIFETGQRVDVSGTTIGKGFAGVVKRHNFSYGGRDSRQFTRASRAWGDWTMSDARDAFSKASVWRVKWAISGGRFKAWKSLGSTPNETCY